MPSFCYFFDSLDEGVLSSPMHLIHNDKNVEPRLLSSDVRRCQLTSGSWAQDRAPALWQWPHEVASGSHPRCKQPDGFQTVAASGQAHQP